jgi:hypothetical protein
MPKIQVKKIKEYQNIDINGYKVDMGFIYHDIKPLLYKRLHEDEKHIVNIEIKFKNRSNSKQFVIEISEKEKTENGMVKWQLGKNYDEIVFSEDVQRYNFKRLCQICEILGNKENEGKWLDAYKNWAKTSTRKAKSLFDMI